MYLVGTGAVTRFCPNSGSGSREQSRSSRRVSRFQPTQAAYNAVGPLSRGFSCVPRRDENTGTEAVGGGLIYSGLNGGSN